MDVAVWESLYSVSNRQFRNKEPFFDFIFYPRS
jgi:hypothetical protein